MRRLALLLLLLGVAWAAGLVAFIQRMPYEEADASAPTDAVVVLTGGRQRLDRGFSLLAEGKARKLFVSGVHREVALEDLLRLSPGVPDWIRCCVELGYEAQDTIGNAAETAEWVRKNGFRSVRLVTADYHMPRSLRELGRAMPEVEIVPHPVFPEKSLGLLVGEYHKYLAALLRSAIA